MITRRQALRQLALALVVAPTAARRVLASSEVVTSQDLLNAVDQPVRAPLLGQSTRTVGPLITREYVDLRPRSNHGLGDGWNLLDCERADGAVDQYAVVGQIVSPAYRGRVILVLATRFAYLTGTDARPAPQLLDYTLKVRLSPTGDPLITVQYREVSYS